MTHALVPTNAWDTHIHCFDPARFPFKSSRAYTPAPTPLEDLVEACGVSRIVIVQASVEDGRSGVLAHLKRIRTEFPHILARGIICMDEDWSDMTEEDFNTAHELGVRYVRIHGILGPNAKSLSSVQEQFRLFSRSYPAQKLGWGLSAQFPLAVWASLEQLIINDSQVSKVSIIADHIGGATAASLGTPEFATLINLLRVGRIKVKISSLYRRASEDINEMKPIVQSIANSAPSSFLWGSDWPHVDSSNKSSSSLSWVKRADVPKELSAIKSWITQEQWHQMLVDNPFSIFNS